MPTTASRSALTSLLAWVSRALPGRPMSPALAGIHLTVKNGVLTASAFDFEQSAAGTIDVTGDDMDLLVSGRLLVDIVKSLPGADVTFTPSTNGRQVALVAGRSKFSLPTMALADYPDLPVVPAAVGTVNGPDFATAIHAVAAAAGTDTALPALTGIHIEIDPTKGTLTLAATDRFRLGTTVIPFTPEENVTEPVTLLAQAKALETYTRTFDSGSVTLHHGGADADGLFGISGGALSATTRLLDGQFPNYGPLLPTSFVASPEVARADLVAAVRRVMLVAEKASSIRLSFSEGAVEVLYGDSSTGQQTAREAVECDYTEEDTFEIAFNPHFLLDGLNEISGDKVVMNLVAAAKPALLAGVDPANRYRYLLMPTRT